MGSKPSKDFSHVKNNDNRSAATTTAALASQSKDQQQQPISNFAVLDSAREDVTTPSSGCLARLTPKSPGDHLLLIPPLGTCGGTRRSAMDSIPMRSMSSSSPTAFIHGDNGNGISCSPLQSTLSTLTPRQTSAVAATGTVAFLPVAVRLNSYAVLKKAKKNDKDEGSRSLEEEFVDAPMDAVASLLEDASDEEITEDNVGDYVHHPASRSSQSLFAIHLTSLRSTEGRSDDTMMINNNDDIQASVTLLCDGMVQAEGILNRDEVSVSGHEVVEATDFDLLDGSAASTATITTSKLRTAAPAVLLSLSSNTRCTVEVLTDGDAPHRIQRARRIVVGVVTTTTNNNKNNNNNNNTAAATAAESSTVALERIPSPDPLDRSQVFATE